MNTGSAGEQQVAAHCSHFHSALKLGKPQFLLLVIGIVMASASPTPHRKVMRIKGKSECTEIWQTVNMMCMCCVVCTSGWISSVKAGSLWHMEGAHIALDIRERNASGEGEGEGEGYGEEWNRVWRQTRTNKNLKALLK